MMPENLMAARLKLSRERPYLASALWALQAVEVTDMAKKMPGPIGVDPYFRLYYDPVAIAAWEVKELTAVLYHEVGHLIRDHEGRAEAMGLTKIEDRLLWNVCGDLEINDDIKADGMTLPKGALLPQGVGEKDGDLAEEYFVRLKAQIKAQQKAEGNDGQGGGNQVMQGRCGSGAGGRQEEHEHPCDSKEHGQGIGRAEGGLVRDQVARDVQEHAKNRGTVPSWLKRWADARMKAKVDWRRTLAALIRRAMGDARGLVDYTYSRVSRRQSALPTVVLPAMRQPTPQVAVVVDTSGSMSNAELAQALTEIEGILTALGHREGVHVISCDAAAGTAQRVMSKRQITLTGGGGTDMRVGIKAALEVKPRVNCVIVVTDCETPWPDEPLRCPLIVVRTSKGGAAPTWAKLVEALPDVA